MPYADLPPSLEHFLVHRCWVPGQAGYKTPAGMAVRERLRAGAFQITNVARPDAIPATSRNSRRQPGRGRVATPAPLPQPLRRRIVLGFAVTGSTALVIS
jgi:hypothetical protein